MDKIVEIQLNQVRRNLSEQEISLSVSEKAKKYLATKGYDPIFGARPLKRLIESEILDEASMLIIENKLKAGAKLTIDTNKNGSSLNMIQA